MCVIQKSHNYVLDFILFCFDFLVMSLAFICSLRQSPTPYTAQAGFEFLLLPLSPNPQITVLESGDRNISQSSWIPH